MLHTVSITDEVARRFVQLALFTADSALFLRLLGVFCSLVGGVVSFTLVRGGALDVRLELSDEVLVGQVLLLLFFCLNALLGLFDLDLVDDVERAAIIPLQIRPPQLEHSALLLTGGKEAIANVRYDVLLLDLVEVRSDFHAKSRSMLAHTHQLLNLLQVVPRPIVLVLLQHLHVGSAVALSHVFDEVRTIANLLALQSVDEGAVPLIETI